MHDLALYPEVHAKTGSSAAKGVCGRRGFGKTRHIEVCYHWLQDVVAKNEVTIVKLLGQSNPADLMTKCLTWKRTQELKELMGGDQGGRKTSIGTQVRGGRRRRPHRR